MEENMIVGDSLLNTGVMNLISDKVKTLPWFFLDHTGYANHKGDGPSFYCLVEDSPQLERLHQNHHYDLFSIPLITACEKHNIQLNQIIRIRVGLITKSGDDVVHSPHVDNVYPHKGMILYVNDSDGDTLFYEERHPGSELVHGILDNSKVTLSKRVTPKFNRYVIFDGLQFHSSSAPKETDYRFVINYNFI